MKPGTQIAYIPPHADGDINHPDVEFGFVTGQSRLGYFCRYWSKIYPVQLRTRANSELTPGHCLIEYISRPQLVVDRYLKLLGYTP